VNSDVYIIYQNSPESRLLTHCGLKREALSVAVWRGRGRSKGGFGKHPTAWLVEGQADIELLCEGLIRILGAKPSEGLTESEWDALRRARAQMTTFENRAQRALKEEAALQTLAQRALRDESFAVLREGIIEPVLRRRLPNASHSQLEALLAEARERPAHSVPDILAMACRVLGPDAVAWEQARRAFLDAIRG